MIIAEGRQGKLAQASGVNDRRYKRDIQQSKRERERKIEREGKKAPIPSRSQEYFAKTSTKMAIAAAGAWNH